MHNVLEKLPVWNTLTFKNIKEKNSTHYSSIPTSDLECLFQMYFSSDGSTLYDIDVIKKAGNCRLSLGAL